MDRNSSLKEGDIAPGASQELCVVYFTSLETYSFTKPISCSYFSQDFNVSNWRMVYSELCKLLFRDYPSAFAALREKEKISYKLAHLIYRQSEISGLLTPIEIAPDFYVETNRSAYDLIHNIRLLLDACGVEYENVVIRYSIRNKAFPAEKEIEPAIKLDKLYAYVKMRVESSTLDPCISLLYCILLNLSDAGYAVNEQVVQSHNVLTSQRIISIQNSPEYKELFREGFIYSVRVNAGQVAALKFQKPFADLLKEDNYSKLQKLLGSAPMICDTVIASSIATQRSKKQRSPIQKLQSRINREIKRKTYLSDILIDEEEYELLKDELHRIIRYTQQYKRLEGTPLLAVGMVQIALRVYQDGNFWGPFYEEIDLPKGDGAEQRIIGTAFYKVLLDNNRFTVEQNRYVQNILLHCYVTDPYLDSYFSFLYAVYTSLLDRDLSQLDKEAMNALIERADKSNLLVKNTAEAFKANPRGAKIRIRNHLKLLDKLFWNPDYTLRTANRIYSKLQLWARHSDKLILESASGRQSEIKGKKRFSKPYLFFDQLRFAFRLVLPQQIVIGDDADLHWEVSGQIVKSVVPDIIEAVVGYKVQECSIDLDSWQDLLGEFKIKLKDHEDNVVRSFSLPKTDVRFFDDEGYLIFTNQLNPGTIIAVSQKKSVLRSSSLVETHEYQGVVLSAFQFENEDILILPNGHAVSIGGEAIHSGLAGNAAVPGVKCILPDNTIVPLWSKLPHIILRMPETKARGTCMEINTERFSLADVATMSFPIDDRSGDTGYWIEMDKFIIPQNGVYSIISDIPGSSTFTWKFALIDRFKMTFEESPYIFEPRGVVRFCDTINLKPIGNNCKKDSSGNAFRFELSTVGRTVDFSCEKEPFSCILSVNVPALFTSFTGDDWSAERPDTIWHSELPDVIYIAAPQQKLTLFVEDDSNDSSSEIREKEYRRNANESFVACDIRWFKSYLDTGNNISVLNIKLDAESTELLRVVRHSIATSCSIFQIEEGRAIRVQASIIGKSRYYADIAREGVKLAEKLPLENEACTLNMLVENGQYSVELFESEEDDSGFGDVDYYSLGKFYSSIVNPYDMTGRSIQVLYVEKDNGANSILDLAFDYYVENLTRTSEKDTYEGMMVVETSFKQLAAFPVSVMFLDLSDPSIVSISFKDEYGDQTAFLYDTRRKGVLKEENPHLPKLTCYRRYTYLDLDEDLFRIEFVERTRSNYRGLSTQLVFDETSYDFAFKSSVTRIANRKPAAQDVTWNRAAYPYVLQTHIGNITEFSKWTKEEIQTRYSIPDKVIDSIEATLAFYGVYFMRKEIVVRKDTKPEMATHGGNIKPISQTIPVDAPASTREIKTNERVSETIKNVGQQITASSTDYVSISSLGLQKMTFNCLKQAGITKIEQLLSMYEKKGTKSFGNIPRFNSEMQRELIQALRREKLI